MATKKTAGPKKNTDALAASLDRALKKHKIRASTITIETAATDGTCLKRFVENGRVVFRRVPC